MKNLKPNQKEQEALLLFYNRFYELYDEITDDNFHSIESDIRFYKLREAFSIYKEILSYEPIKYYIKYVKNSGRPPLEGIIADDLFSFVRNLLLHFPVFKKWDDVYINKNLATWSKSGQIDKFLKKSVNIKVDGNGSVKYRIWETKKKKITYFEVNFPQQYDDNNIYLKNIIPEKVGMKFCMALMRQVIDSQVENADEPDISIMSQVYIPVKHSDTLL